jgi:DNA-directed RNA polymerase specialized sigma24 family protein
MSTSVPRRDELDTGQLPGKRATTSKQFCESLRLYEKDLYKAAWALCDRSDGIENLLEGAVLSTWEERRCASLDRPLAPLLARKLIQGARAMWDSVDSVPAPSRGNAAITLESGETSSGPSVQVHRALLSLPRESREIFVLRDLMNFSANECAEILRISHDDARRLISHARLRMTQQLSTPVSSDAVGGGQ